MYHSGHFAWESASYHGILQWQVSDSAYPTVRSVVEIFRVSHLPKGIEGFY